MNVKFGLLTDKYAQFITFTALINTTYFWRARSSVIVYPVLHPEMEAACSSETLLSVYNLAKRRALMVPRGTTGHAVMFPHIYCVQSLLRATLSTLGVLRRLMDVNRAPAGQSVNQITRTGTYDCTSNCIHSIQKYAFLCTSFHTIRTVRVRFTPVTAIFTVLNFTPRTLGALHANMYSVDFERT